MKMLAIDSSGLVASVAIMTEEALIAEYTVNYKKTHSQTLLPMIDEVVGMIDLDLADIDAVALSNGPGSFTGLRIGSATAKGLGLALDKPLIGVPTVDALAYNLCGTNRLICPVMDARRNQVYTGLYEFRNGEFAVLKEQTACDVNELIEEINQLARPVIYLGDGVDAYKQILEKETLVSYEFAPAHMNKQRAGAVAALAMKYYQDGKVVAAGELSPTYLRLSQAERELAEKQGK